jgi:glycosyltransferase involved in cell wall biosynthesis
MLLCATLGISMSNYALMVGKLHRVTKRQCMAKFNIFLSVAVIVQDQESRVAALLQRISKTVSELTDDHEIIIVDNASTDGTLSILKTLTSEGGLPNLQVFALTKQVDIDIACWVGVDHALGDFVAIMDPLLDDSAFLSSMLEQSVQGTGVVFATNLQAPPASVVYRLARSVFNYFYKCVNGVHLAKEAPQYRVLSRNVVNFVRQHPQAEIAYRHLPITGGFTRINLTYSAPVANFRMHRLSASIDRSMRLLVSTTRAPMRVATLLSMTGAGLNLLYSIYVLLIAAFKTNVAPGWVSLSLQQSGMFFLISLVLLILGEYVLQMARLSNEGPLYHVGQEFMSAHITRHEKLNIEEASLARRSAAQHGTHL